MNDNELDLLNEHQAAQKLGLSVATLRRRRLLHQAPTWIKLGARVLYRASDLQKWISENTIHVGRKAN
jgi:predicted DNA-binding transcriptional regulator AlpA